MTVPAHVGQIEEGGIVVVPGTGPVVVKVLKGPVKGPVKGPWVTTTVPAQVGQSDAGGSVVVPSSGPVVERVMKDLVKELGVLEIMTVSEQEGQSDARGMVVVPAVGPVVKRVVKGPRVVGGPLVTMTVAVQSAGFITCPSRRMRIGQLDARGRVEVPGVGPVVVSVVNGPVKIPSVTMTVPVQDFVQPEGKRVVEPAISPVVVNVVKGPVKGPLVTMTVAVHELVQPGGTGNVVVPGTHPVVVTVVTELVGTTTVAVQYSQSGGGSRVLVSVTLAVKVTVFGPAQVMTVVWPPEETGETVVTYGTGPVVVTVIHSWQGGGITVTVFGP
jgi:hypothetical protein